MNISETIPQNQTLFDRTDTKALKGIAVLLMLFHHIAGFPERMPVGFEGFQFLLGNQVLRELALNARFCVSIFFL